MREYFIESWARRAFKEAVLFEGTLSGGIAPPKQFINCTVLGRVVEIRYDLPETCGLSDVRYHVTDPDRVRKDVFVFTDDGRMFMNGTEFPGPYEDDPWTADDAAAFRREFTAAFRAEITS